jgi:hypothetical protein
MNPLACPHCDGLIVHIDKDLTTVQCEECKRDVFKQCTISLGCECANGDTTGVYYCRNCAYMLPECLRCVQKTCNNHVISCSCDRVFHKLCVDSIDEQCDPGYPVKCPTCDFVACGAEDCMLSSHREECRICHAMFCVEAPCVKMCLYYEELVCEDCSVICKCKPHCRAPQHEKLKY